VLSSHRRSGVAEPEARHRSTSDSPTVAEPHSEQSLSEPVSKKSRHPLVHHAIRVARVGVLLAVVLAIAYASAKEWDAVSKTISSLSWESLVLSVISIVVGMFATVRVWQHLLAALGTELAYPRALQINLVGQLGKYLPGSVWSYLMQAELGRRYDVPRPRALVTLVLSAGLAIATALTISVFAIGPLLGQWGHVAWLLALGPLAMIIAIPRVMQLIANLMLKVMRRPGLEAPIKGRHVAHAVVWSFVSWLLFGVHLWALASSLGMLSFPNYLLVTGAFGLAMSAGFVAFVLPSGVGVREAVIVAAISPIMPGGPALAFALTSRLLFTVADVSSALLAILASRISIARNTQVSGRDLSELVGK
jgi:hypothetical protein